ncbi:hypothetical protein [Bradyrhizobium sp.]|uniref:hypothetical protein n=1 Tax=Bradyrhizobium sp. TaxID=376 RepID=UPI002733FD61|nr:hypothetical protein [Bradyrhizobium sp.]MDP3694180.1 hypothetical protein [Bradyrhizobium sp.]
MFGKSVFLVVALAASLAANVESLAQDAGVSGIRGPGSAGGLNNSVNDPSGAGNAAPIAPPPPNIAVPAVPSVAPLTSTRVAPAVRPRENVNRRPATVSRSERRRPSRAPARARGKPVDSKFSICRGC